MVGVSFSIGFSSMDFPAQKRMGRARFLSDALGLSIRFFFPVMLDSQDSGLDVLAPSLVNFHETH